MFNPYLKEIEAAKSATPTMPAVPTETLQTKRAAVEASRTEGTYANQRDLVEWKTQVLDEFDALMRKFQAQYVQHKKWNSQAMQLQGEQALKDLALLETVQLKTISEYRTELSRIRVFMGMDLLQEPVAPKVKHPIVNPIVSHTVMSNPTKHRICTACRTPVPGTPRHNHACQMPGCSRTFWLCDECAGKISHNKCPERSGCSLL